MNERRRQPRIKLTDGVAARTRQTAEVEILDISLGGMRVRSATPLSPRKEIVAWLPTAAGDLKVRLTVRRCRASIGGEGNNGLTYEAGLEFKDLDRIQLKEITSTYLDELEDAKPKIKAALDTPFAGLPELQQSMA